MDFDKQKQHQDEVKIDFPTVPEKTIDALENQHARSHRDYEAWKEDFVHWLATKGKDPEAEEGYSDSSVRQTSYKTGRVMRWLWNQRGYTVEITPEDADQLMRELARYSEYGEAAKNDFATVLKRIFKYLNQQKGREHEWECKLNLSTPGVTNRAYIKPREFRPLYEATLEHGTVQHYHSCTPEERDAMKAHLAQRFEKPKENITKADFARANSFKIPSMVSVTIDCGLRPIEIERSSMNWLNLPENELVIPPEDAAKGDDEWVCILSDKSVRALKLWIDERNTMEKYENRNEIWLNKRGNPYETNALNYLLDQLIEESTIEPAGRDLSWYSIRHGVATSWAQNEPIKQAKIQLRHKDTDTTLGYANAPKKDRKEAANSKRQ